MLRSRMCSTAAVLLAFVSPASADEKLETTMKGAQAYRICAACHSLQPDVHLSGPSLAGLWGKKSVSIEGYGRYTDALKNLDVIWDENALQAWLAQPQETAPGTTMTFQGVEDDQTRMALIEFLRMAMTEGGGREVVSSGLIPQSMADGQIPPDLTAVGDNQRVTGIRHCGDAYYVTTADGAHFPFWETNVRLKVDTSKRGPIEGDVVLLRSGMAGDRVSVVFPSRAALVGAFKEECK